MKTFKEKIEALNVRKDTVWKERALYRRNNPWLQYSAQIAVRILAAIKDDKDLNQSRLAEALGVSRQQVSKILKGQENLTLETIFKISQALGVPLITFPPHKDRRLGDKQTSKKPKAGK